MGHKSMASSHVGSVIDFVFRDSLGRFRPATENVAWLARQTVLASRYVHCKTITKTVSIFRGIAH